MKQVSFQVTISEEDLTNNNFDTSNVSDKQMCELRDRFQEIFEEIYFSNILTDAAVDVDISYK